MKNNIKYSKLEIKKENEENIVAIDKTRLVEISEEFVRGVIIKEDYTYIERRCGGAFFNKALYLSSMYDWVIGKDEHDVLCLVPLKRRVKNNANTQTGI